MSEVPCILLCINTVAYITRPIYRCNFMISYAEKAPTQRWRNRKVWKQINGVRSSPTEYCVP